MALPACCSRGSDGVRVAVRLKPRASAERVVGLTREADGGMALSVAVTAPPVDGKANEALIRLLARLFHLPPRRRIARCVRRAFLCCIEPYTGPGL